MSPRSHSEVERKYDVTERVDVPDLTGLTEVARVADPVEQRLEAVYQDTADLALASARITLRRRTGGDDAGWHLKLPGVGDRREEVRVPLSAGADEVPAALLDRVRVHVRDRPVRPVARIETRRVLRRLVGPDGRVLGEVCDDRVVAHRLRAGDPPVAWREWEAELVEGSEELLDEVATRLLAAGAAPAAGPSKLARALALAPTSVPRTGPTPQGPAGALLLSYLDQQVTQLVRQDPLVRADAPDSVHKMRVALRRSRSALATYRPLLTGSASTLLRAELKWLGSELGEARDTEVIRARIETLLETEPDRAARDLAAHRVGTDLGARYDAALAAARDALNGSRYFRLLDALEDFLADPPLARRADRPAGEEAVRLLQRDRRRLAARATLAASADAGHHDPALHEVRKAAKRLRYAAESATPVLGERAESLTETCTALQDVLGEYQDSTVSRATLAALQAAADRDAETPGAFDRLSALEAERARALEPEYLRVLDQLPSV